MWTGDEPIEGTVNATQNFCSKGLGSNKFLAELTFATNYANDPDKLTLAITEEGLFQIIENADPADIMLEAYELLYTLAQEAHNQVSFMARVCCVSFPLMRQIPFGTENTQE